MKCQTKYLLVNIDRIAREDRENPNRINYVNLFSSIDGKWKREYYFRGKLYDKRLITYNQNDIYINYKFIFNYNKVMYLETWPNREEKVDFKIVYYVCG